MTGAPAFHPFFDEGGKQIGWQSADLGTVVALDQLPGGAATVAPPAPAGPDAGPGILGGLFAPNQAQAATALPPGFEMVPRASALPPGFEPVPYAESSIDRKAGAPGEVRAMVGGAPQQDRLEQIQQYYPDAQPYQDDNFVFTDPQTKRPTLYNPPGLDFGDIPSVGRDIASGIGATVGAGAMFAAAPFTGGASLLNAPVGAGVGATAGGGLYDIGRRALGGVDTRSAGQHVADAGIEFGTNAAFQRAADWLPGLAKSAVTGSVSRLTGKTPQELWQAFRSADINPTAGQVTGNRALQGLEQAASKMPTGATRMGNAANEQLDTLGTKVDDLAVDYGSARGATPGATPTEAGTALQRGGAKFVKDFQDTAEKLYQKLYQVMAKDTPAKADNVLAALQRQRQQFAAAPELGEKLANPTIKGYEYALTTDLGASGGTLPYHVLSSFRSKIGRMLSDPQTVSDIPRAELKEVYAALSKDMEEAARAAGPEALARFQRANAYYAAGLKRIEAVIDKVVQAKTPEKAYQYAMEGSGAKGGGGTKLMQLRRSMPAEEWDVVASVVLRKMGEAVPSQQGSRTIFSPETFLSRWNDMSKGAQNALFRGTQYGGLPDRLQTLLDVAAAMRETKYMSNPSGTAGQSMFMAFLKPFSYGGGAGAGSSVLGIGGGAEIAAVGAVAGGLNALGPYVAARALTNQKVVEWLVDLGTVVKPNGITAHLARLMAITEVDPEIKEFAQSVVNGLRAAPPSVTSASQAGAGPAQSAPQSGR